MSYWEVGMEPESEYPLRAVMSTSLRGTRAPRGNSEYLTASLAIILLTCGCGQLLKGLDRLLENILKVECA